MIFYGLEEANSSVDFIFEFEKVFCLDEKELIRLEERRKSDLKTNERYYAIMSQMEDSMLKIIRSIQDEIAELDNRKWYHL